MSTEPHSPWRKDLLILLLLVSSKDCKDSGCLKVKVVRRQHWRPWHTFLSIVQRCLSTYLTWRCQAAWSHGEGNTNTFYLILVWFYH